MLGRKVEGLAATDEPVHQTIQEPNTGAGEIAELAKLLRVILVKASRARPRGNISKLGYLELLLLMQMRKWEICSQRMEVVLITILGSFRSIELIDT